MDVGVYNNIGLADETLCAKFLLLETELLDGVDEPLARRWCTAHVKGFVDGERRGQRNKA